MAEAAEAEARPRAVAEAEPDLSPRGEPECPGEREDEPGLSSSGILPFTTASEVRFRSSDSSSSIDLSFRSSVGDLEVEDDDMMYRLMQSEYEEIPSFRWIPSPLRWWKIKRSSRSEKLEPAAEVEVESDGERRNDLAHSDGPVAYTLEDLEAPTSLRQLGVISGPAYKITLGDGTQVAVKILSPGRKVIAREEFEAEVNVLGRIRHPNLLALRGYFFSEHKKMLVFDNVPIQWLSSVLHVRSSDTPLNWPTRMNIAIGIARGLHHLHAQENIVHGNLTSGNILIDDRTNAKISDYGISKIRITLDDTAAPTAGTFGYRPPKFSMFSKANTKTDVYSFGVIMLEMLTGKYPTEPIDGLGLPQWVASVLEEGRTLEVFDQKLMRDATRKTRDELLNALYLALCCMDPWPYARPEMLHVLQQLEEIRHEIVGATNAATAKGGDESTDEVGGLTAATTTTGDRWKTLLIASACSPGLGREDMVPAGEAVPHLHGEGEVDLLQGGELRSPGEREDEPALSSSPSLSFSTASEESFRSSVDDMELEDGDMKYRLMQSEYEEIPSFRWIPTSLRWWKTKRSRRRTHPSRSNASGGGSSRMEKPVSEADAEVESRGETRNGLVHFDGHPAYTVDELLGSSAVLLGKGTYGTMYGVSFVGGKQVAVKRLTLDVKVITRGEFEAEVNVLGRIRHPNLLTLRAYFFSEDEKMLVFDYMTMGSLSSVLNARGRDTPLDCSTVIDIAIGIARGLHHLHTQENMVHGNLTSGNILLDDHTNAKISDYGISNIRTVATIPARITAEALRYRAPEFTSLKNANTKTDVYSLGMIMIDILTGKSPAEASPLLLRDASGATKDELLDVLHLALRCVDPSSNVRPDMLQVLQQLEEIKQGIAGDRGAVTAQQGEEPSDDDIKISPPSSPRITEERMAPLFETAGSGTSPASNILDSEENPQDVTENIISSASVSATSREEAVPMPTNSCKDEVEELSTLTSQGDLEEGENILTPTPREEFIHDPSSKEELQVPFELEDVEFTTSLPSDLSEGNESSVFSIFDTDEAGQAHQTLPIVSDQKLEENMSIEEIGTTSGGALVSPLSSINWAEVTLQARLQVPTSSPLITSDPDQGYQRFFKTLYDLAHRSPPLPSTVLEVQLNRMIIGLQSLGYPLDAWLKAATLVLVSAEKREYIECHVGDYKVHVETQLAELVSVIVPVKEEISRTRFDITTLTKKQEELVETVAKLEDQLAVAKEQQKEVAGSLGIARDQLVVAEAKVESVSNDMDRLNQQHSAIPDLRSAMLHELPSLDEVFDSSFREIMTRKF